MSISRNITGYLFFKGLHPALPGAPNHTNIKRVEVCKVKAGIFYRFVRSNQGILCKGIGSFYLGPVQVFGNIKTL